MTETKKTVLSRPDLDNLLEGCQIIGFDWRYVYLNDTAQLHNRFSNEQLLGKRYADMWPGIEKTEVYSIIKNCLENRIPSRLENEFVYPDSTIGWFDLSIQPVPEGVFILSVDITERKETEKALLESEKKFKNLVSVMQVGVVIQGPHSEVLLSNQKALELLGLTEEQFLGKTSFDRDWNVIHEDGSPFPGPTHPVAQSISTRKPVRDVIMGIYRPVYGDRMWLIVDALPQLNEDGSVLQVICTFIDINKRIEAEESLRKSETKFRKIYEEGPFGMALVNKDFKIFNANNTFCSIIGYSEKELQNLTFKDISFEVEEREINAVKRLIKGETTVYKTEKRYRRKDGKVIWGSLTVTANFSQDGRFLYNLAIIEDISARKNAEEFLKDNEKKVRELNETLEQRVEERTMQLKSVNKELEAFTYSVSHDLRAPLRSVNGFTQILMDEYAPKLDSEGVRICNIIQESSQKMGRLIDELLAFSRLSRSEMIFSEINMTELITATYSELIEPEILKKIEFGMLDIINSDGDPNMIKQVWTNLLSNAIKYSSKNDLIKIDISCRKTDRFITYCIKDNGVGFDMDFKDKLFGVFQRLHSVTEFEGTGVGLAIVQRIILRHGGEVWANSEPGKGAEFYFSLPSKEKISI